MTSLGIIEFFVSAPVNVCSCSAHVVAGCPFSRNQIYRFSVIVIVPCISIADVNRHFCDDAFRKRVNCPHCLCFPDIPLLDFAAGKSWKASETRVSVINKHCKITIAVYNKSGRNSFMNTKSNLSLVTIGILIYKKVPFVHKPLIYPAWNNKSRNYFTLQAHIASVLVYP